MISLRAPEGTPILAIPHSPAREYIPRPMDVILQRDERTAASLAARVVSRALKAKPDIVLGLAKGKTMELVYRDLVRMHQQEGLDFSRCRTFNLDEYVGLGPDDPNSFHSYMRRHLFDHVNVTPSRIHLPNGMADDLEAECVGYEALISKAGGIDLQLLGIGLSGHIGFNEPLSAFSSRTRVQCLAPATLEQNGALFGDASRMPRRAITMGVGTIQGSRECLLLAAGGSKAEIVAQTIEGPITAMISATSLHWHPRCHVILDEAAAAKLRQRDYYRWTMENDPAWKEIIDEAIAAGGRPL
jgi:glucosamine-6-phosphate deaminase